MNYIEEAIPFDCLGDTLLGVLALPKSPAATGVVVIVGGPQYRVGSHRQFVLLARALAAAGYAVLRFDYRGMGDSEGAMHDFESVSADIGAAIAALQTRVPTIQKIALWGLCDGASAALLYCHESHDSRVSGLCLLNPWVRSEVSQARTQVKHYYTRRLMQKEFWLKLLRGKVARDAPWGFAHKILFSITGADTAAAATSGFQRRMAIAWRGFQGHILMLLSGDDYTAKEFITYTNADNAWQGAMEHPRLAHHTIPGADHTFSTTPTRLAAENFTLAWLARQTDGGQK